MSAEQSHGPISADGALSNDVRQRLFSAAQDLRELLQHWNATSEPVKRAAINDAVVALELAPLPDDFNEVTE